MAFGFSSSVELRLVSIELNCPPVRAPAALSPFHRGQINFDAAKNSVAFLVNARTFVHLPYPS